MAWGLAPGFRRGQRPLSLRCTWKRRGRGEESGKWASYLVVCVRARACACVCVRVCACAYACACECVCACNTKDIKMSSPVQSNRDEPGERPCSGAPSSCMCCTCCTCCTVVVANSNTFHLSVYLLLLSTQVLNQHKLDFPNFLWYVFA